MMMGMRIVDCGLYAIASPTTSREIIQPTEKVLPLKWAKELERNQSVVVLLRHRTVRRFVAFAAQVVQISWWNKKPYKICLAKRKKKNGGGNNKLCHLKKKVDALNELTILESWGKFTDVNDMIIC